MLIEMAVGDAFGAGYEFVKDPPPITLDKYRQHPKHTDILPGMYTDDTQMAVALAELLLTNNSKGEPSSPDHWTHHAVAGFFVEAFHRDPRKGYAQGFYRMLTKIDAEGSDPHQRASLFLRNIYPHSRKNGGAMRAGPIGLLPTTEDVIDRAMFQASLTHGTQEGMKAAAASALMAHYFYRFRGGERENLPYFLDDYLPLDDPDSSWSEPWSGKVLPPGTQAVRAAITAIVQHDNLAEILKACVAFGGDTDTTAAIAMCAASLSPYIDGNLPEELYKGLEGGPYGLRFLSDLDGRLLERFPCDDPEESSGEEDFFATLDSILD